MSYSCTHTYILKNKDFDLGHALSMKSLLLKTHSQLGDGLISVGEKRYRGAESKELHDQYEVQSKPPGISYYTSMHVYERTNITNSFCHCSNMIGSPSTARPNVSDGR